MSRLPPGPSAVAAALDAAGIDGPELEMVRGRDAWELLLCAILLERAHPLQVVKVMAVLTEHFVSPQALAAIDHRDLEPALRQLPLYRQKARSLVEAARAVVRVHHGQVPEDWERLAEVPGVSRAAAALAVSARSGAPAIAATPEVRRVVHRIGWTIAEDAGGCERALRDRFPPEQWSARSRQLLRLGLQECRRVSPRCARCQLSACCARQGVVGDPALAPPPAGA